VFFVEGEEVVFEGDDFGAEGGDLGISFEEEAFVGGFG